MNQDCQWMPRSKALFARSELRHRARYVRVILVELGSAGIEAYSAPDGAEQTFALVQGDEETATEFASRVARRIGMLERAGLTIERALLLLGPYFDAEATLARLRIARALAAHSAITPGRCPELVLSAISRDGDEAQIWLPRLVAALMGEAHSEAVTISFEK